MAQISINYIEFNVKNIDRSKAFYKTLGWTFADFGPTYCEFNSGSIKGGFYQVDEITMPITDFPGGKRFHFKDLDGYELAVWCE